MKSSKHILLCGEVGIGKSTLIARLLEHSSRPVYGFITKKLDPDENGFLIRSISIQRERLNENLNRTI